MLQSELSPDLHLQRIHVSHYQDADMALGISHHNLPNVDPSPLTAGVEQFVPFVPAGRKQWMPAACSESQSHFLREFSVITLVMQCLFPEWWEKVPTARLWGFSSPLLVSPRLSSLPTLEVVKPRWHHHQPCLGAASWTNWPQSPFSRQVFPWCWAGSLDGLKTETYSKKK